MGDDGVSAGFIIGVIRGWLNSLSLRGFLALFIGSSAAATAASLIKDPRGFIVGVIYDIMVKPVATAIWDAGYAAIDTVIVVGFGGDYAFGVSEGTSVGLLDAPFLVLRPVGVDATQIGSSISTSIESFNQPIVDSLSQYGIAAPFVGPVVILLEMAVGVYTMYIIIHSIDLPFIDESETIEKAAAPFRRVLEWLLR